MSDNIRVTTEDAQAINVQVDGVFQTTDSHSPVTVSDSAEIDFTLTGQDISASLVAGSIDETKLDTSVNASLDLADSALQPSDIGTSVQAQDTSLDEIASNTYTRGDIIVANATNNLVNLPAGTAGQVLTSDGTDVSWQDASGGGGGTESRLYITEDFGYSGIADYTSSLSGVYLNSTSSDSISGGRFQQQTSASGTSYSQLVMRPIGLNIGYNLFDLSPSLSVTMDLNNNGNTTSQSGVLITSGSDKYSVQLSSNNKYAGFINKAGTIYAVSNDGTGEEATDISATWPNLSEHIGHIACSATEVKFYVDGTLIATHTTKVPTGADNSSYQMTIISDNNGTATIIQNKFYSYTFSIKVA